MCNLVAKRRLTSRGNNALRPETHARVPTSVASMAMPIPPVGHLFLRQLQGIEPVIER